MGERTRPGVLQIGSVSGIPIHVHVSWALVFAVVSWTRSPAAHWAEALALCSLLFGSVVLHEIGHTLVALGHGLTVHSITLLAFGGVAQMDKEPEDGWTELKIAAVGPGVSLVLAALFGLAASMPSLGAGVRTLAWYMAWANLGLAGVNVLPAFPLDGGRLLRAALWIGSGRLRATQIATGVGALLALGVIFFGVFRLMAGDGLTALWCLLVGWFLKDGAVAAYERVRLDEGLRGLVVRDAMLTEVATIPAHLALSELAPEHFLRGGYRSYPVVRGDRVVGLLSIRQVLALSAEERQRTSVQAVMMPLGDGIVVGAGEPLLDAVTRMARSQMGRLLVVEDGRLEGLLSMSSVFRHVRVREVLLS